MVINIGFLKDGRYEEVEEETIGSVSLLSVCMIGVEDEVEDDKEEEVCENCNEKTKTFLQSQEEQFNWCSECNAVTNYQLNE